ncbi:unnamed protein product, partial [Mesorhabditis spiculigera]
MIAQAVPGKQVESNVLKLLYRQHLQNPKAATGSPAQPPAPPKAGQPPQKIKKKTLEEWRDEQRKKMKERGIPCISEDPEMLKSEFELPSAPIRPAVVKERTRELQWKKPSTVTTDTATTGTTRSPTGISPGLMAGGPRTPHAFTPPPVKALPVVPAAAIVEKHEKHEKHEKPEKERKSDPSADKSISTSPDPQGERRKKKKKKEKLVVDEAGKAPPQHHPEPVVTVVAAQALPRVPSTHTAPVQPAAAVDASVKSYKSERREKKEKEKEREKEKEKEKEKEVEKLPSTITPPIMPLIVVEEKKAEEKKEEGPAADASQSLRRDKKKKKKVAVQDPSEKAEKERMLEAMPDEPVQAAPILSPAEMLKDKDKLAQAEQAFENDVTPGAAATALEVLKEAKERKSLERLMNPHENDLLAKFFAGMLAYNEKIMALLGKALDGIFEDTHRAYKTKPRDLPDACFFLNKEMAKKAIFDALFAHPEYLPDSWKTKFQLWREEANREHYGIHWWQVLFCYPKQRSFDDSAVREDGTFTPAARNLLIALFIGPSDQKTFEETSREHAARGIYFTPALANAALCTKDGCKDSKDGCKCKAK